MPTNVYPYKKTRGRPRISSSEASASTSSVQSVELKSAESADVQMISPQSGQIEVVSSRRNVEVQMVNPQGSDEVQVISSRKCDDHSRTSIHQNPRIESDTNLRVPELNEYEKRLQCCVATARSNGMYDACSRPAFGIWLNPTLRAVAVSKNFPFAIFKSRRHHYSCLYHRRIIINEPALKSGESLSNRDLSKHDSNVITSEEYEAVQNDPLIETLIRRHKRRAKEAANDPKKVQKIQSTTFDSDSDEDDQRLASALCYLFRSSESNIPESLKQVPGDGSGASKTKIAGTCDSSKDPLLKAPLQLLSASTIRRYKKHFNLPHRSSTLTKPQLMEGVIEHFSSIPAPPYETAVQFLHAANARKNRLDLSPSATSQQNEGKSE